MLSRSRWLVAALFLTVCHAEAPAQEQAPGRVDLYGDPLPPGALARLGTTRWRLRERNAAVAFTNDGRALLASGGADGTVTLWDVANRKKLGALALRPPNGPRGPDPVARAVFAAGGKTVYVWSDAGLTAWDVASGRKRPFESKNNEAIEHLAVAPAGGLVAGVGVRTVAAGWQVETLTVWDAATGKVRHRVATAALIPWVRALAFAPDGKRLACGGDGGALWILDPAKGTRLHQFRATDVFDEAIACLDFAPDGGRLVAGTFQGSLHEWDPATGKKRRRWNGHAQGVGAVAFSHDGKTLASAGRDSVLLLWAAGTEQPPRRLSGSSPGVDALCFSPDDRSLAASGGAFPVQLLDVTTGKETHALPTHRGDVFSLAYSPDGKMLATGSMGPEVRLWEPSSGKPLSPLESGGGSVLALEFVAGGKELVAAGSVPAGVRRWDVRSGKRVREDLFKDDPQARPVILQAGGNAVWWAMRQKSEVALYDVRTGVKLRTLDRGVEDPYLTASPDGKLLAGSVNGNAVYLWDGTTGKRHTPGWMFEGRIVGLAFAPDGRTLAVAAEGEQSLLFFCDVTAGRAHGGPVVCPERVTRIAYAPDGRALAAVTADQSVRVWDVETRQQRATFKGHERDVVAVAFSPDGRTLATGSADTTALVWDLTGGITGTAVGLPTLWADLASSSAETAHRAIWGMVGHEAKAGAFLRERVRPVAAVGPEALAKLVIDVGSERFSVRERAFAELEKVAELAAPALRDAVEKPLRLEVRRRLEKLLEGAPSADRLRELRAVEVLERLGTAGARQVLRGLADGAPGARLTREAKGALLRLSNH